MNTRPHHTRRNQRGMTLVEALVAMALAAVIAGIVYTVFIMQSTEFRESAANALLQRQYEVVANTIGDTTRSSFVILASDETWSSPSARPAWPVRQVNEILMYSPTNLITPLTGFRINNGAATVDQYNPDEDNWTPINAGGADPVKLAIGAGYTNFFELSHNRDQVEIALILTTDYRGYAYFHHARGDAFRCRPDV